MTTESLRDKAIRLAKEAGYGTQFTACGFGYDGKSVTKWEEEIFGGEMETQRIKTLVRLAQQEALEEAAKVCEDDSRLAYDPVEVQARCATEIRAMNVAMK